MKDLSGIDLVIFDCDGVLVDSEPLANAVLASHATAMGWTMDRETSQSLFKGMTMKQIHLIFEKQLGRDLNNDWIERYYRDTFSVFKARLRPIEGISTLIERVKRSGREVCVASQGPMRKMKLTLGITGLWDYFDGHIYSAHDVARPKPFPDLFLHAARMMDVSPRKCCVIEDSLTGLKAAHAADMRVIYYASTLGEREVKIPASDRLAIISKMNEIVPSES